MHRFLRYLGLSIGIIIILASLAALYLLTGVSSAETQVRYTLDLSDPSAKTIAVSLTIQPDPMPFVDLYLREPAQGDRQRVTAFTVERNGKPVSTWQTLPFFPDAIRLWNGFSADPLTITYQIDPLWMKGERSPRSYLGPDFAYIRGMVTLYTPLSLRDVLTRDFAYPGTEAGFAEAEVLLPQGWKMVSPFGSEKIVTQTSLLRNAYIGFGPFILQDLTIVNTPFLLGVYEGLPAEKRSSLSQHIPTLFQTIQGMTGFSPNRDTCFWSLTILPTEPIHGGASGTGSLVVQDDINLIAHEMFHWWNGATLLTTSDANWIKEGFTTYYAAKSLYAGGLWTEEQFLSEIEKFEVKYWAGAQPHPVNIIEASNRLVLQNDQDVYDTVYHGGALLAHELDRRLQAQGKSLDMLWPILKNLNRPVASEDFLKAIEALGGADLAGQAERVLNGQDVLRVQIGSGE